MKKTVRLLLAMLLAVLMVLSLMACGEPAETTKATETTKAAETTAAKTKVDTTKVLTPRETTTKVVTTKAPWVDPEPVIPAAEHTEHKWFSVPTFTPYAEKKADGTIGELGTRCRYEGCTAIKEGHTVPTLVWLDFTAENNTKIADYVATQQNVARFSRDTSLTKGKIVDNEWYCSDSGQVMFEETIGVYKNFNKFTISYDAQMGATTGKTGFMGYVFYGPNTIATYFFQLRTTDIGTLQVCRGTTTGLDMQGVNCLAGNWYHFDCEVDMYPENPAGSVLHVYMAEWQLDSEGRRTVLGERQFIGDLNGLPVDPATANDVYTDSNGVVDKDGKTFTQHHLDILHNGDINASGFRISNANAIKTLDNLAITLPYVDESHVHSYGEPETVTFAEAKDGYIGYKFAKCEGEGCNFAKVIGIKEGNVEDAPVETDYVCLTPECGCRFGINSQTAADCVTAAYDVITCAKCGAELKTQIADALGHDFDLTSEVPAACGTNGYKLMTCKRCPEQTKEWMEMTSAHKFTKVYTAYPEIQANNAIGYYTCTCATCGGIYKEDVFVKLDFNTEGGASAGTLLDYIANQDHVLGFRQADSAQTKLGEVVGNVYHMSTSQTLIEFDSNNDKKYITKDDEPDWVLMGEDYIKLCADIKIGTCDPEKSPAMLFLGNSGTAAFGGMGQLYIAKDYKLGVAGNTASKNSIFVSEYDLVAGNWYHFEVIFADPDNSNGEKAMTVWVGAYDTAEGDNFKTLTEMVNIGTFRKGFGSMPAAPSETKYFLAVKLAVNGAVDCMDNFEVVISSTKTN